MSERILALDPGSDKTAFVVFEDSVREFGILPNEEMLERLKENCFGGATRCAIEMVACYGMAVGREVFQTCVWIGRFSERTSLPVTLVYRKDVKMHLCHTMKAKDANIRQALIDMIGPQGKKASPGPTFGMSSHTWAALGVAITALANHEKE